MRDVSAVLLDLDGTLYIGDEPIPGADGAIARLRHAGLRLAFVTNTTTRSRAAIHETTQRLGLPIEREEIFSALGAARRYLESLGRPRVHLVVRDAAHEEFEGLDVVETRPDVIVVGDVGDAWTFALMQRLFTMMHEGAMLVALHKGRSYQKPAGLSIDVGAFIAGLEYATGSEAVVVGKPARAFFELALDALGVEASRAVMVGDDVRSDVGGAQRAGLRGVLVRTGKYREEDVMRSGVVADAVVGSVVELPELLARRM